MYNERHAAYLYYYMGLRAIFSKNNDAKHMYLGQTAPPFVEYSLSPK